MNIKELQTELKAFSDEKANDGIIITCWLNITEKDFEYQVFGESSKTSWVGAGDTLAEAYQNLLYKAMRGGVDLEAE